MNANNNQPASNKSTWKAGRDTVYNHPLFSKKHALDSIRAVLFSVYYFRNDIDSTKFIGYDNARPPVQREDDLPAGNRQQQHEIYLLLVFIGGMLVFSLAFSRKVGYAK